MEYAVVSCSAGTVNPFVVRGIAQALHSRFNRAYDPTAPIHANHREQAMFKFLPLGRAG